MLGTDSAVSNNDLDLFQEMDSAVKLQRAIRKDWHALTARQVLDMATIEGARVLGLSDLTGSLEPGKRADIVTVDLRKLHTTPLLHGEDANIAQHLVFASNAADVDSVWVDGKQLVQDHRLLTGDEDAIRSAAQSSAEELFARRRRQMRAAQQG